MSTIPSSRDIARHALDIIPYMMRVMSAEMRASGLDISPAQMGLMGMLTVSRYTLGDLATLNHVSAPTMSNSITVLEERGWVIRERSSEDRRVVWVSLSGQGRKVLDEIDDYTRNRISSFVEVLSATEKTALMEGLTLLNRTFKTAFGVDPDASGRPVVDSSEPTDS